MNEINVMVNTASSDQPPMDRALGNLSNVVSDLQEELGALWSELRPILTPEDDQKAATDGTVPRQTQSEIVNYINDVADRVRNMNQQVNVIRHRLELT